MTPKQITWLQTNIERIWKIGFFDDEYLATSTCKCCTAKRELWREFVALGLPEKAHVHKDVEKT
jgi:hypothetical protein